VPIRRAGGGISQKGEADALRHWYERRIESPSRFDYRRFRVSVKMGPPKTQETPDNP